MDLHLLVILSCLLVAGTAHEKGSSAGPPNKFLKAFYAQWTCNEKDEPLNEYEMTSLIFKETLQISINMTEGKEFSECYINDVTSSTFNGPQVMYLYNSENNMCNNTQHILTTFNTESSSNYVSCLLHHPTSITSTTSTAFLATALCANIDDKTDPAPLITSVTCLGNSTPTKGCPAGWTNLTTGCYKLTNAGYHQQAQNDCRKDGGYLVEVDNREENDALSLYYKVKALNAWLGATDIGNDGKWVWSHSGKKVSFTNWQDGEPNGKTHENCLRFTLYHNGRWNDADCSEKQRGVCEL